MHLDGTSNFVKHYETYNVVTGKCGYLKTVIQEIYFENTETRLNVLIYIIKELEESLNKSESAVFKKLSPQRSVKIKI